MDQGDVVDDFGKVGEELGVNGGFRFAHGFEVEGGASDGEFGLAGGHAGDSLSFAD